jgi:class 3 adenylate cyclase
MRQGESRPGPDSVQRPSLVLYRGNEARRRVGLWRAPEQINFPGGASEAPTWETPRKDDVQSELIQLEASLIGDRRKPAHVERALATVLITDIVESTARAATVGDAAWRKLLDRHDRLSYGAVCEHGGRLVKRTGDGLLATFEAPVLALHCAKALRAVLSPLGIVIRAGVHTGEVELRGDDVAGIAVHIAARVAAVASPGELLASRTVKDLVTGSDYRFISRGLHNLRGIPDGWELLTLR